MDEKPLWQTPSFWLLGLMLSAFVYGIFINPSYKEPGLATWREDVAACEMARAYDHIRFESAFHFDSCEEFANVELARLRALKYKREHNE